MKKDRVFFIAACVILAVICARLFFLQIIRGGFYRERSEHNRIQILKDFAPRGTIYDRNRAVLVTSRPSFCVYFIPWLARNRIDSVLEKLGSMISLDLPAVKARIAGQRFRPFQPLTLKEDVPFLTVSRILECQIDYPGVFVQVRPWRSYPNKRTCSHILGYIQEINQDEFENLKEAGYEQGDFLGKTGIEKTYEKYLRGIDGGTEIEVDVMGRPAQPPHILAEKDPQQGANIVLSIDRDIQESCEKALGGMPGAVVVMDPSSGEILGMASKPDFDPAMFTGTIPAQRWKMLAGNPRKPFASKAVQCTYPPGSAFKFITIAAALEKGVIKPDEIFECKGGITVGGRTYKCWNEKGHGWVNMKRGIAESCDVYFYHLGARVGPEAISEYAKLFGLGVPTGISVTGERKGLVPSPEWKRKRGSRWFLGDTFNFSIGQGFLLTTPLQMARALCALFNGGKIYRPKLVNQIIYPKEGSVKFKPVIDGSFTLKPSTLSVLEDAMRAVVTTGTGISGGIPEAEVMGKTGTAQNPFGKDHAWFVAYARPIEGLAKKRSVPVVITVMLENGGSGGAAACPVAACVLSRIYSPAFAVTPVTVADTSTDTATF